MGTEYVITKEKDKTLFELGKGTWDYILDSDANDVINGSLDANLVSERIAEDFKWDKTDTIDLAKRIVSFIGENEVTLRNDTNWDIDEIMEYQRKGCRYKEGSYGWTDESNN